MSRGQRLGNAELNDLWASLVVEELCRLGVTDFCIAPGSRSTPLALAAARRPEARITVHFDERGCGFYALGLARAHGRPAALICTSGTAAANLYPATVEAAMDGVPLLLLTADRPPESRDTGANQTIPQLRLFGDYPRWQTDLPPPSTAFPAAALLTTMDQAVHRALAAPPGPVHLNMAFREPLTAPHPAPDCGAYCDPIRSWQDGDYPYTRYHDDTPVPALAPNHPVAAALRASRRGLLVVGRLKHEAEAAAVIALAGHLGWPALADIGSGLRLGRRAGPWVPHHDLLLDTVGGFPRAPDTVLHLGGGFVSKWLLQALDGARPAHYIRITDDPRRHDPNHQVSQRLGMGVEAFAGAATTLTVAPQEAAWLRAWQEAEGRIHATLDHTFEASEAMEEPGLCRLISRLLPADSALFLASSMPVRDMDSFADPRGAAVPVGCNRGASGIDGTLASACGYAAGLGRRLALVCGDQALLHDLNSLALVRASALPITVVAINNDGGGIFSFLPVAEIGAHFEPVFAAPHGLAFDDVARGFGLDYRAPRTLPSFAADFAAAMESPRSTLIEVRTERAANVRRHREIASTLRRIPITPTD